MRILDHMCDKCLKISLKIEFLECLVPNICAERLNSIGLQRSQLQSVAIQ